MKPKLKISTIKWFLLELLIISYLSFENFEGVLARIYDIVLILWITFFLVLAIVKKRKVKSNYYIKQGAVWIIVAGISIIIAPSLYRDNSAFMFMRLMPVILYAFTIVLSLEAEDDLVHIWRPFFIGGLIGVVHQLSQVNWAYLSMSIASNALRVSLSDKIFVNTYAYQLTLSFVAGYFLLCIVNKDVKKKMLSILIISGMVLLFVGMILTGSRKVLFSTAVFLFVVLCYGRKNFWKIAIVALVVVVGYNMLLKIPAFYNTIGWRIEMAVNDSNDASINERDKLIEDAFHTGVEHPLGVGLDNSKYYSSTRQVYAHNNYLEFFADYGAIGTALCYWFYVLYLKRLLKWNPRGDSDKILFNCILAALIMEIITEYFQIVYYNFAYHVFIGSIALIIWKKTKISHAGDK